MHGCAAGDSYTHSYSNGFTNSNANYDSYTDRNAHLDSNRRTHGNGYINGQRTTNSDCNAERVSAGTRLLGKIILLSGQ